MRRGALAVARTLQQQQGSCSCNCGSSSSSSFSGFLSSSCSTSANSATAVASSSGRNAVTTSSTSMTSMFRRSSSSSSTSSTPSPSSSVSRLFENVPPIAAGVPRAAASGRASSSGRAGGVAGGGGGGIGRATGTSSSMPPPPPPPPLPPSSPALTYVRRALGFAALATGSAAAWLTWTRTLDEVDEMVASLEKETSGTSSASSIGADASSAVDASSSKPPSQPSLSSRLLLPPLRYYRDKRAAASATIASYADPPTDRLLPDLPRNASHVRTLVLDLDGVLVKSDWRRGRGWRTFKRPGVDAFLQAASQYYELVLYTDHLPTYADPILDRLDPRRLIQYRLYRDSTRYVSPLSGSSSNSNPSSASSNSKHSSSSGGGAQHARDLASLNRDPRRVLFVTASREAAECPASRDNAVLIPEWGDSMDPADTGLLDLLPFLEALFRTDVPDVRPVVESYGGEPVGPAFRRRMMELEARKKKKGRGGGGGSGGSGSGGGGGGGGRFAFFRN